MLVERLHIPIGEVVAGYIGESWTRWCVDDHIGSAAH